MKSVNHMCIFIDLFSDLQQSFTVTGFLDLLEQFFLILYYFFENIVFFIRVNIFTYLSEEDLDIHVNWPNFLGDVAGFLSVLIHFIHKLLSWREWKSRLGPGNLLLNEPQEKHKEAIFFREIFDTSIALVVVSFFHSMII